MRPYSHIVDIQNIKTQFRFIFQSSFTYIWRLLLQRTKHMCLTVWPFLHPSLGAAIKLSFKSSFGVWDTMLKYFELLVFVRSPAALSTAPSNTSDHIGKTLLTLGMLGRADYLDRRNENRGRILCRERHWLQRTTGVCIMCLSIPCPSFCSCHGNTSKYWLPVNKALIHDLGPCKFHMWLC